VSLILNIDTSANKGMVSVSRNGETIGHIKNENQHEHASFLQPAIENVFSSLNLEIKNIDAVAVANGPGSYTGLRVGLASAKGICFALNKPLITLSSLHIMAYTMKKQLPNEVEKSALLCPMIDARRMEVFTALYDSDLNERISPCAMILDEHSFEEIIQDQRIIFFGDGAGKIEKLIKHPNAGFLLTESSINSIGEIAEIAFNKKAFSNLAYVEPFYLKAFFNG
jgi:tRNA threonylcarbamoyladenosine biosynthesis protein TsaB